MEERFIQQLKKGALEMLVLEIVCRKPAYGYEMIALLKQKSGGLFELKEGTMYPILYRLEDEGLIESSWFTGEGRTAPKKIYQATQQGREVQQRRRQLWTRFNRAVESFFEEDEAQ